MNLPHQFNWIPAKGKVPLVKWTEYIDRAATENERANWEAEYPNSDRGIVCGPTSNLFVLDDDGSDDLKSYHIPRTPTVKTPRGGRHYYFRWTPELEGKVTTKVGVLKKVDVRGNGGFVAFYGWELPPYIAPFASAPQWLIDLLPNRESRVIQDTFKNKPENWMIQELENVQPGSGDEGRNPTFVRAIGRLKAKGLSIVEVKSLLAPWAQKYNYAKLDALVDAQFERYPPLPEVVAPQVSNHSLRAFMVTKKTIPYIVPGIVGKNTINVWAGLQESRKSWLLVDLAVAVASGTSWLGAYPCQQGKVVIIDQERPGDEMKRRIEALTLGRGLEIDSLEGNLIPKADLEPPFKLNIDESFKVFESMIEEVRPTLVLMDSLSAIQSGDIMSKLDMQKLFERLKVLRLKYQTAFVILHHENKGAYGMMREKLAVTAENIEGSGVIGQVPEGLMVARNFDGDTTTLHHVKNSYGVKVAPFMFRVRDLVPDKSRIAVEAF